jgi:glutathione peroxidase
MRECCGIFMPQCSPLQLDGKISEASRLKEVFMSDLYAIPVKTIDGKATTLASFKGKTLLIVNTASECGFTPQYDGLEKLYAEFKNKGFAVLGFPSNDFGAQEPGSDAEIKDFCQTRFHVDFPLFAKAGVKGSAKQPLYDHLTKEAKPAGEVQWNFEKFLIGPDGRIVGRFGSKVKPEDAELRSAIENNLPR